MRGLDRLERSYLSLDTEGRVMRLDSFAKFLAPGLRLGWATGAPAIIEKLAHCVAGTSLGAGATSQVVLAHSHRYRCGSHREAGALHGRHLAGARRHLAGAGSQLLFVRYSPLPKFGQS